MFETPLSKKQGRNSKKTDPSSGVPSSKNIKAKVETPSGRRGLIKDEVRTKSGPIKSE